MISPRTQAMLLLTLRLDPETPPARRPLDVREWNLVAEWLAARGATPEALLQGDGRALLDDWEERRIPRDRLLALLDRGVVVDQTVQRWHDAGIWLLGRTDEGYPVRLKEALRGSTPPVIFGYGPPHLVRGGGVAIVGSRDSTSEELAFAETLGRMVSEAGLTVISGGARGIDERAAHGAFITEGTVVTVLGDGMLRAIGKKQFREHLASKALTLLTPYSPEAGFSSGNAMGRNRLIYSLAQTAVAVSSTNGYGGTFGGASEALRQQWVRVWAVRSDDPTSGNPRLIEEFGAESLDMHDDAAVRAFLRTSGGTIPEPVIPIRDVPVAASVPDELSPVARIEAVRRRGHLRALDLDAAPTIPTFGEDLPSHYELFLEQWRRLHTGPVGLAALAEHVGVLRSQVSVWLTRAIEEGYARRSARAALYELLESADSADDGPSLWTVRRVE